MRVRQPGTQAGFRPAMRPGWRLKRLHKLIMTSTAYQQASNTNARGLEVDPENAPARRQVGLVATAVRQFARLSCSARRSR